MFEEGGAQDTANELRRDSDRIAALTQTILSPRAIQNSSGDIPLSELFDIPSFIEVMVRYILKLLIGFLSGFLTILADVGRKFPSIGYISFGVSSSKMPSKKVLYNLSFDTMRRLDQKSEHRRRIGLASV
jgi:hypothetical protein